jgi:hypothetical protein
MKKKHPAFYRDLLESILQETADWTKYVRFISDELTINAPVNHAITIGEETVVLTKIEVPLTLRWKGMFGAYFMDQDFDHLSNIYDDKNAWAQVENSVGKVLGLNGLKLGKGRDFFEPLNGGDDPGIRPIMHLANIEHLIKQYAVTAGKNQVLKMLLSAVKYNSIDVIEPITILKQQGINWPELDSILQSLNATKNEPNS